MAVERLSAFDADGTLSDRTDLVKSYLYAATIRIMVADMFDDFVFSDRRDAAPAVGEDNMFTLYEDAIVSLDNAFALATELGNT
ncbi:MAG: hypothetical protein IH960_07240, partial [Chloroflexi bacterium]|nr:hypothetical protein [Chloroflexota bacterium]